MTNQIGPVIVKTGTEGPSDLSMIGTKKMFQEWLMRSILLWVIGVPVPLILLLAFCTHHL